MSNALIPRDVIHAWSEQIAEQIADEQVSLQRVLRDQRRLTRFVQKNQEHMAPATVGVSMYMTGVIARMFDMAGGRLKSATHAQVNEAATKVQQLLGQVLPLDDGFAERFRSVPRAQAHILDEAYMALMSEPEGEEEDLDRNEALKVLMLMWVITEVLDANWKPGKDFEGEASYTYVHIEPEQREEAGEE